MCQVMLDNGDFDPALCPLLQNLSPEEIAERLREPAFQACIARSTGRKPHKAARETESADLEPPCMAPA